MLKLTNTQLEQLNTGIEFIYRPGSDLHIHWLDPLWHRCKITRLRNNIPMRIY